MRNEDFPQKAKSRASKNQRLRLLEGLERQMSVRKWQAGGVAEGGGVENVASGGSRGDWRFWRSSVRFKGGGKEGVKQKKFAVENTEPSSDNHFIVRDLNPHLDDYHFAQECLEGKSSSLSYFQETYGPKIMAFLKSRGATQNEASEIAQDMWTECVMPTGKKARPKLERYQGGCALQSWLNTIALNKLVSRRRGPHVIEVAPPDGESGQEGGRGTNKPPFGATEDNEPEKPVLLALLKTAIDTAFQKCPPEDFVLLQLVHCDQLREKELAVMFRCDTSTISRRLERASEGISRVALRYIEETDPYLVLEWDDFLELCRSGSPSYYEVGDDMQN